MKQIETKGPSKRQWLLIVTLVIVFVLSIVTAVLTILDLGKTNEEPNTPPEILEGEDIYLNTPIAYPQISESQIQYILVSNKNGSFDLTRPDSTGAFWLGYDVGLGKNEMMLYAPPIISAEGDFDYQSLYATVSDGGYGQIYMLTYLCTAIGTPYFSERIPLPEGEERDTLLLEYGFGKDATTVAFTYTVKNADGTTSDKAHTVTIGGHAVSDIGYYFMVDGRDYVYYTSSSYFQYALGGFHTFVNGKLVAEGIASDSSFEPFLTTDFREWHETMHNQVGERVESGSAVVVGGSVIEAVNAMEGYIPAEGEDGYKKNYISDLSFDLSKMTSHPDYKRISSLLTSLSVGKVEGGVTMTLIDGIGESEDKLISFDAGGSAVYGYRITAIESVFTENEEITRPGEAVGDRNLIKVSYTVTVNGKAKSTLSRHAVLDLSNSLIDTSVADRLRASTVGTLAEPIEFSVNYTKENSVGVKEKFVISDILKIYDASGKAASVIDENSYVTILCYEVINGAAGEKNALSLALSDMSLFKHGDKIKSALIGRGLGSDLSVTAYEDESYYEILSDFTAYEIDNVDCFITSKLIVAFKFQNASKRDPYYGESFYENTLPKSNPYSFYGLNASACENVVKFLGGVSDSGSVSAGLAGTTVAVGLTHENMKKYELYSYRIYFELPRGISDISEGTEGDSADDLSDYGWLSTLGFNLYISRKFYDTETGTPYRYVGSDMYDLVARVDGEELDFVEYNFIDFYARRTLLMVDIENVDKIEMNFNLTDVYGSYTFDVNTKYMYVGQDETGKSVVSEEYFSGSTKADIQTVSISATGRRIDTEFEKILASESTTGRVSVTRLYNVVHNGGKDMGTEGLNTVGVSNFKDAFEATQLIAYAGTVASLSDAERALALASKENAPELTMRIKLTNSAYYYTYEFRRFDDRRVMVTLYQSNSDGAAVSSATSDFYVSTFALKKLVRSYVGLLNGEFISTEDGYGG